jgi:pyrroloquinoline quinone (PQQ) biosynthesis protein C
VSRIDKLARSAHSAIVEEISAWLSLPANEVDQKFLGTREHIVGAVRALNEDALSGDADAFYEQQLLLNRIYQTIMQIPQRPTAEGSVLLHEVTRHLENATMEAEDRWIEPGLLDSAPVEPRKYLSWLKNMVRRHRAFKHPYYTEFIRGQAQREDLRTYVIQESLVDGRFDDLLAMMQIGTSGGGKMEIARNFWDEMGNGEPEEVHTHLFNKIYEVFDLEEAEFEGAMTANDLLSGNLVVLLCRYRHLYPEAVGYLGMTEWLVPDRFRNVVGAWERLGLPDVGITYHRLHITVDSRHATGWFHNVVLPMASSEYMRRGVARGSLWRVNSSARHLDERLTKIRVPDAVG